MRSRLRRVSGSERGVALLIVLWLLVILMIIVFSFSFMARTETTSTLVFKEGVEKRLVAEAGIEAAITELFRRTFYKGQQTPSGIDDNVRVDGTLYGGSLGSDAYTYRILEESGRININKLDDASAAILGNLLVNRGLSLEDADIVVDSVLDWKDQDDEPRLHGAESDYYMALAVPYKAKNGAFDSVEELLMVRGMTPEILYGSAGTPGIFDLLTVHSGTGAINVNTAPREVLAALPGMGPDMADLLIAARQSGQIGGMQEAASITGADLTLVAPYLAFSETNTYTIEAAGDKQDGRRGFTVTATVSIQGDTYRYVYYKSPAGISAPRQ